MDPLDRADALLHRAQSRGAYVVTPESAISPMDAANTQQIPRAVVRGADAARVDPDSTTILTDDEIREQDSSYLDEREPTTSLDPAEAERTEHTERPGPAPRRSVEAALDAEPDEEDDEPDVVVEEVDGLIPTTTQRMRMTLSRRLDG